MHHHVYVTYIIHMECMSPPMDPETWGALAIVVSLTQQRRQQYRPKGSQWQPRGTLGSIKYHCKSGYQKDTWLSPQTLVMEAEAEPLTE